MIRVYSLIFLFLFFLFNCSAQEVQIDSLRLEVKRASQDSNKLQLTTELVAKLVGTGQYDKADIELDGVLTLAEKKGNESILSVDRKSVV